MLLEVYKFSKFIHGCAVLLPEDVSAMPYWIDDVTLAESIIASGAGYILANNGKSSAKNDYLLPHDAHGNVKAKLALDHRRASSTSSYKDTGGASSPVTTTMNAMHTKQGSNSSSPMGRIITTN